VDIMRVVSLVPSLTETVMAWGIEPVACTRFCEQPGLRHVGGTKDPDIEAIVALRPDVVLVNDEENRRVDVDALSGRGLDVHVTTVATVDDVAPMLRGLAAVLGVAFQSLPLPERSLAPRRFVLPIWRRPWMLAGPDTYGSSMLEWLGWTNACRTERYPELDADGIGALGADVVVAPSEPYPFSDRHHDDLATLVGGDGDVVYVDGQDLFWWGTRTPAALGRLLADTPG
jgi:ABC-type Fe3+-hydroxamate transport system substrate-binding protein